MSETGLRKLGWILLLFCEGGMGIQLNQYQIQQLANLVGGSDYEEVLIEIEHHETGPDGPGLYAWYPEYPEEGKAILRDISEEVARLQAIAWPEQSK